MGYLVEQQCEDPWLIFEAESSPLTEEFGKHWVKS